VVPEGGKKGRTPTVPRAAHPPLTVQAWADALPDKTWETISLRPGTKGKIRVQYVHRPVVGWAGTIVSPA
jgi:hypothetical protein